MSDDRANTIDISGTLTNSPVTVNQNQDGAQTISNKHIEYVIDDATVRVFSQKPAEKMNAIFLSTIAFSGIGILADILGVLSYVGIQQGISLLILAPCSFIVALITKNDRWLMALQANETANFKEGLWYEKLPDGNFLSYVKRSKCIYPKCNGLVQIVPAPPRERPNHSLVGKCSVGGVRHTYTVDFNGIGYPQEFDWRALEQVKRV